LAVAIMEMIKLRFLGIGRSDEFIKYVLIGLVKV
jgi:hypothetical protein